MKPTLTTLLFAALLLLPGAAPAQQTTIPGKLDGTVWITRALFPGQPAPTYTGTARFLADGTLQGPGLDAHSPQTLGMWSALGNLTFSFVFASDMYDSSGNFVATHIVRGVMTLSDDGATATGKTLLQIIDTTGAVTFRSPGPTGFTATRLTAVPF